MSTRRRLTLNLIWLYAGDVAAKGLALVAFGWLARTLGEARYGELEFAVGIFFIFFLVQEAGLDPYGSREGAKHPERVPQLYAGVVTLRAVLSGAAILLMAAVALALDHDILLLYAAVLVPAPFLINWVFQSRDEMSTMAFSSLVRQVVLVAGVLLFVRSGLDARLVPLCDAAGLTAAVLFQHAIYVRKVGRPGLRGGIVAARRMAPAVLPLAASSVAWAVRIFFPLVALGLFEVSGTGFFAGGHRLVVAMHAFVWLYFVNLLPSLARASQAEDPARMRSLLESSLRLVSWTVLPGCLLLTVLAPRIMPLVYGDAFVDAAPLFAVQVWMLSAAFLSGHQRFGLIAMGRQRDEFRANLAGAAVTLAACIGAAGRLTPAAAATIFVAGEVTTLLVAHLLLQRTGSEVAFFTRILPAAGVTALLAGLALTLLRDHPGLMAGTIVATLALAAILLLRRSAGRHAHPGPE